jgi:hypothetical protein
MGKKQIEKNDESDSEVDENITSMDDIDEVKARKKQERIMDPPLKELKEKMKVNKKKIRSEKQMLVFQKAQENLRISREKSKRDKELRLSLILEEERSKNNPAAKPLKKKDIVKPVESDSSDEEETIIIEKRSKKKKPVKRIIVEESDTDDDDEEEPVKKEKAFKSQQNKKSIIKVAAQNTNQVPKPIKVSFDNMFC